MEDAAKKTAAVIHMDREGDFRFIRSLCVVFYTAVAGKLEIGQRADGSSRERVRQRGVAGFVFLREPEPKML
jgi:hypothetical protein